MASFIMECKHYLCLETLSNKLRFNILVSLKKGPKTVNELAKKLGVEQSKLSHALKILKNCNFVKTKKQGKYEIYSLQENFFLFKKLNGKSILETIDFHRKNFCKRCWKI